MPTKEELQKLIAESRAKAEQDKLDAQKLVEDNIRLQEELEELKLMEMPPQAPPTGATILDRMVAVSGKLYDRNEKTYGQPVRTIDAAGTEISLSLGAYAPDALTNGLVDKSVLNKFKTDNVETIRFVSQGTPAVNHPISEALGTNDGNTIASMKFVRDEAATARGEINAAIQTNTANIATKQDTLTKQLVVVFNDGSSKSFKVG